MAQVKSMGTFFAGLTILTAFAAPGLSQSYPPEVLAFADTVYYNGTVLTVDSEAGPFTVAEGVAVRDGKILAVGSSQRVRQLAGPETEQVDLEGKTLMPGFIDTHTHPNRSSLRAYFDELSPEVQAILRASGRIQNPRDKAHALEQIKQVAADEQATWVKINADRTDLANHQLRLAELDQAVPDRPLFIILSGWWGIINSRTMEQLQQLYGEKVPGLLEEDGKPTGHVMGTAYWMVREELVPKPPVEVLAKYVGRYLLERLAPEGITTFSTRLAAYEIRAYRMAEQQGTLPLRLAFGHEVGRWNPRFARDMNRVMTDVMGYGTDRIWLNSISIGIPDSNPLQGAGSICSTFPKLELRPDEHFTEGLCLWEIPGDPTRQTILEINRRGYRVGNTHTYGDRGLQMAVETLEQAQQERPLYPLTALDHSQMFNPTVIRKSGELGMIWSMDIGMFSGRRGEAVEITYGKEVIDRMLSPVKSLLDAGALVSFEGGNSIESFATFITRRTESQGNPAYIRGARESVGRLTALRIMTLNGAKYVLKEDVLGSIQPGKWADLVVLDKNPLHPALSDDDLYNIQVLQTIVEGELIWDRERDGVPQSTGWQGGN